MSRCSRARRKSLYPSATTLRSTRRWQRYCRRNYSFIGKTWERCWTSLGPARQLELRRQLALRLGYDDPAFFFFDVLKHELFERTTSLRREAKRAAQLLRTWQPVLP